MFQVRGGREASEDTSVNVVFSENREKPSLTQFSSQDEALSRKIKGGHVQSHLPSFYCQDITQ